MPKVIVSLKDTAVQVFITPFVAGSNAQAVRSLRDAVNDVSADSDVRRHPEDFELYQLGSYDEETGIVCATNPIALICRAKDLVDAKH